MTRLEYMLFDFYVTWVYQEVRQAISRVAAQEYLEAKERLGEVIITLDKLREAIKEEGGE